MFRQIAQRFPLGGLGERDRRVDLRANFGLDRLDLLRMDEFVLPQPRLEPNDRALLAPRFDFRLVSV